MRVPFFVMKSLRPITRPATTTRFFVSCLSSSGNRPGRPDLVEAAETTQGMIAEVETKDFFFVS